LFHAHAATRPWRNVDGYWAFSQGIGCRSAHHLQFGTYPLYYDADRVDPTGFTTLSSAEKSIQGIVWQIELEEVKSVRAFTAR